MSDNLNQSDTAALLYSEGRQVRLKNDCPAPLRIVLGSQARARTLATLRKRVADVESQAEFAASTNYPPGE
jgi:hypothetical protein